MKINYSVKVDIGKKKTNDDRALVLDNIVNMGIDSGTIESPGVAVVCDGCGGYAGGDVAAQTVLETIKGENIYELLDENYLASVLNKCKENVFLKKEKTPQFTSMCTTIAGCIFGEDKTVIFHSGDSRVYRFDGTYIAQMTIDHSIVQEMVEIGEITEVEAMVNPCRNVITRCIGFDCLPPDIYVSNCPIFPGEMYILCSDGLWEYVGNECIVEILLKDSSLEDKANEMVEMALKNGSDDNITVCICARNGEFIAKDEKPFVLD